jgi:hypothetical protein
MHCEEVAMRVPAIGYHKINVATAERRFDRWAIAIFGGGVLMSVTVWALAIAMIIDICGFR